MIVNVLWVFCLQWHQLPRWVPLMYIPTPCYPSLFYPIHWRLSEGKLKATPTSTSRSYHHHHSLGRSMSKKGRLYFGFATLELPILQCTLLRWQPQQPRKKLTSTVETYKYLQLSTPETSSSQEFSIFLFVSLCHSSLYLDLSKCFKKKHYLPYPSFLDVYSYSFFIYQILDAVFL